MYKKIFQLGLSRTGTSSFHSAVKILGFTSNHYPTKKCLLNFKYDVLSDIPVLIYLDTIVEKFPKAKYIVTVRDFESWLTSVNHYIKSKSIKKQRGNRYILTVRKKIYGKVSPTEKDYKKAYEEQYKRIFKTIKKKKLDHIVMDICNGEGWEKLCPFLNKEIPDVPFPRRNATK